MKKAFYFCHGFILALLGSTTGRVLRVCADKKENPWKYEPPFNTWLEALKLDFIINGSLIIICIIAMIVLKTMMKKHEQKNVQD